MNELAARMRRRLRLGPGTLALLAILAFFSIVLQSGKWSNGVAAISEAALTATPGAYELAVARTATPEVEKWVMVGGEKMGGDMIAERRVVQDVAVTPTATPICDYATKNVSECGRMYHSHGHGIGFESGHSGEVNHHEIELYGYNGNYFRGRSHISTIPDNKATPINVAENLLGLTSGYSYLQNPCWRGEDVGVVWPDIPDEHIIAKNQNCIRRDGDRGPGIGTAILQPYQGFVEYRGCYRCSRFDDIRNWRYRRWVIERDHYHFHPQHIVDDAMIDISGFEEGSEIIGYQGEELRRTWLIDGGNMPLTLEMDEDVSGIDVGLTDLSYFDWNHRFFGPKQTGLSACHIASGYLLPCYSVRGSGKEKHLDRDAYVLSIYKATDAHLGIVSRGEISGTITDGDGESVEFSLFVRIDARRTTETVDETGGGDTVRGPDIVLEVGPEVPNAGEILDVVIDKNASGGVGFGVRNDAIVDCEVHNATEIRARGVGVGLFGTLYRGGTGDIVTDGPSGGGVIAGTGDATCRALFTRASSGWLAFRAGFNYLKSGEKTKYWSRWAWKWFITPDVSFDVSGLQFEEIGERDEGYALELDVGDLKIKRPAYVACVGDNCWKTEASWLAWNIYRNGNLAYMVKNDCHAKHFVQPIKIRMEGMGTATEAAFSLTDDGVLHDIEQDASTGYLVGNEHLIRGWKTERPDRSGTRNNLCIIQIPLHDTDLRAISLTKEDDADLSVGGAFGFTAWTSGALSRN